MGDFYTELKQTLQTVLDWSESFKKGYRNYKFDIDDELFKLSEKHRKNFQSGELLLIYNLLDFYCDAIKHDFDNIDIDYSLGQARSDIKSVIDEIGKNSEINLPHLLKERLKNLC